MTENNTIRCLRGVQLIGFSAACLESELEIKRKRKIGDSNELREALQGHANKNRRMGEMHLAFINLEQPQNNITIPNIDDYQNATSALNPCHTIKSYNSQFKNGKGSARARSHRKRY